ncbi:putative membrane protein, hemolysin III-like protein [Clostridiaceae bacterium JG1575]|nr:putative membrane protein, hemolysin III-like protein [Clostridiaceae bacterium JG1575]
MTWHLREPINSITHLAGAALSLIGLVLLLVKGITHGVSAGELLALNVFGLSLIALYTTSGVYHMVHVGQKALLVLKKLDHSMIFVLIAGTYTPVLAFVLRGPLRVALLALMWGIAISGVFFKVFWIGAPRVLYTTIYVVMGWMAVFILRLISSAMGSFGVLLLLLGGVSYTVGAVIYALKKPNLSQSFGFHELFHCFVLLGSLLHFIMIYRTIG